MSTIFSKIIEGELPCFKVYEDNIVLAFLDINPIHPGHTLVVPKKPFIDGIETDPEILAHIIKIGQKIAIVQKETLKCGGVNFLMSNGAAAGQEVFHTHLHVIPRFEGDGVFNSVEHGKYKDGEAEGLAVTIADALSNN